VAQIIVAEIGVDMGRCPTANHLASWAGLCPGNTESAGKRKRGQTTKGTFWPRRVIGGVRQPFEHKLLAQFPA
jgi:hypothetical protein